MKEEDELDILEYRFLNTRAKHTAKLETKAAPAKCDEKPEIHVHVALPEAKETPAASPKSESPRRWKFTHKYDRYNKLIETIAEAE